MPLPTHPESLISWNINGLRAILKKGFMEFVHTTSPDLLCLQEVKAHDHQIDDLSWTEGYHVFWNAAAKPGYAGTAVLSRIQPLDVSLGIGKAEHDQEGRVLTLEFPHYHVVSVYTPNSQRGLRRLPYRIQWDLDFLAYLQRLEKSKPVILCGDLNVAHKEIDLANPKSNRRNAGFTDEERAGFDALLDHGFVDSFRQFHPEPHQYTWWSYRAGARQRNIGWRIDYWLTSERLRDRVRAAHILHDVPGSDHCPVQLDLAP